MPWTEVRPMDQKIQFISDYLDNHFSFSQLCYRYGISRKTGYKWVHRYLESGDPESLKDRSRRPFHSPTEIGTELKSHILKIREKHPSWGPSKILWRLEQDYPERSLPAYSTVALILKRNGYIKKRRPKMRRYHPGRPLSPINSCNDVWTADFKGHFKTLDGLYCYPLTIADGHSRYLFSCRGMLSPRQQPVKETFRWLFEEYGLPCRIRTDNGNPFASNAMGRLSRLSVWWIRLGIMPELIEPGCPQQNGRHERMHKTLKYETTIPPAENLKGQQYRFDAFLKEYNNDRPHEGIGMTLPAQLYEPSSRPMPSKLPLIEYPSHYEIRRVSRNGGIRWNFNWVNVGQVLSEEYIGFEEIDIGIWDVYYGPLWLGIFYEKLMKIKDHQGKLERAKRIKKCNPCP